MRHIVQISFHLDPERRQPEQLLRNWPSLPDIAMAVADGTHRVSVIQACHHESIIGDDAVRFYFQPCGKATPRARRCDFYDLAGRLDADVFHVHGLVFPDQILQLARICPGVPILAQDHANRPPGVWRRPRFRRAFESVAGVAFTASDQAEPYRAARLFHPALRVFEIPESSSHFRPGDQAAARKETGLSGSPCIVWIGRLNENKDPHTVIEAIEQVIDQLPGLQLWCFFTEAPLLETVRRRIAGSRVLTRRVHLEGKVEHRNVESLLRAADLFVSASHSEGSGYALIEALACGLPPVVTRIPSFRTLTAEGSLGRLWSPGQAHELAEALCSICSEPLQPLRDAVVSYFERELSFEVVGRKLRAAYADLGPRM